MWNSLRIAKAFSKSNLILKNKNTSGIRVSNSEMKGNRRMMGSGTFLLPNRREEKSKTKGESEQRDIEF